MIREAVPADIVQLSEYWYDHHTLLQQTNPAMKLMPDARRIWEAHLRNRLDDEDTYVLVYESDKGLLACLIGCILKNTPGLLPDKFARVEELFFDLHTQDSSDRIASELYAAFKSRVSQHGVQHVQIPVSSGALLAQAFWRGKGAKKMTDMFWIMI